jgi:hypothetical protein
MRHRNYERPTSPTSEHPPDTDMRLISRLAAAAVILLLVACGSNNPVVGEWETVQGGQVVKLIFEEDSTFVMDLGAFSGEGRYSLDEQDLVMTPTGDLAASVPGGFTGTVDWSSLEVCSPGGVCSSFEKVD